MVAFTLPRDTGVLMARLGLTRKQYYSKMNLIGAGLVMRKNGKHLLTSLCKVAYESNLLIGQAIENYWKLKAIDSIEMSVTDYDLSAGERKKIVETLIKKKDIKNILLG